MFFSRTICHGYQNALCVMEFSENYMWESGESDCCLEFDSWSKLEASSLICSSLCATQPIKGMWCSANVTPHVCKVALCHLQPSGAIRVLTAQSPEKHWLHETRGPPPNPHPPQLTEASPTWALLESVAQTTDLIMKWPPANSTVYVRIIFFGMTQLSFAINPGVWVQTTRWWAPDMMLCFPKNRYVIFGSDSLLQRALSRPRKTTAICKILASGILLLLLCLHAERVSKNRDLWHLRTWVMRSCGANGNNVAPGVCPVLHTSLGPAASLSELICQHRQLPSHCIWSCSERIQRAVREVQKYGAFLEFV